MKIDRHILESFAAAGGVPTLTEWQNMTEEQRALFTQERMRAKMMDAFWVGASVRDPEAVLAADQEIEEAGEQSRMNVLMEIAKRLVSPQQPGMVVGPK